MLLASTLIWGDIRRLGAFLAFLAKPSLYWTLPLEDFKFKSMLFPLWIVGEELGTSIEYIGLVEERLTQNHIARKAIDDIKHLARSVWLFISI